MLVVKKKISNFSELATYYSELMNLLDYFKSMIDLYHTLEAKGMATEAQKLVCLDNCRYVEILLVAKQEIETIAIQDFDKILM